ncbi:hypothetical protein LDENG_00067820 [Lucifuga dentata]|nr:hypothetical protein LDENG_00067820 [Lucifuga dentata]
MLFIDWASVCQHRQEHLQDPVHIAVDLTWTIHTTSITKKAQRCLHFLRSLPPPILTTSYQGTIENILSSCITL